jgi:hypothetical protein
MGFDGIQNNAHGDVYLSIETQRKLQMLTEPLEFL